MGRGGVHARRQHRRPAVPRRRQTRLGHRRFRPALPALIVVVALLSVGGAFLGGALLSLLALVLAFGLVGTPFAMVLVFVLLNSDEVRGGTATANPISVVVFAAVFGLATLALGVRFLREQYAGGS